MYIKGWNYPLRDAKLYSNKHRRAFKKKLITELEKVKDVNDVELPYDCKKMQIKVIYVIRTIKED